MSASAPGAAGVIEARTLGPRRAPRPGAAAVGCDVAGEELWFESDDFEPAASAEAFASALLPAALQRHRRLRLEFALDPAWVEGAARIAETWAGWWQTPAPLADWLEAPVRRPEHAPEPARAGTALCFSGGLDSFDSLLSAGRSFDLLILCIGYDIALEDGGRIAAATASLREVAAAVGAEAVVLRTNLRRHPRVRGAGWGRIHGGALAALGHLAGERVGELVISATHHRAQDFPWGSHWQTDPGWSSTTLRVVHAGDERTRLEKLRLLLDEPLVRRHLRVCWENRDAALNCGRCEKCCRTLLHLHVLGADARRWPFGGGSLPLAERIAAVASVHPHQVSNYTEVLPDLAGEPELRAAVEGLVARAEDPAERRQRRLRRQARREARA